MQDEYLYWNLDLRVNKTWKIGADTSRAKKKEETHQRILDAASQLFEAKGFYETTTSDIAKAASVSPGSIYAHFGSPGKIMAELHAKLVISRTNRLTAYREEWPSGKPAWDLLLVMLDEVWGVNKNSLQMENVCAFHSWCWVCAPEDYAPMRVTYQALFAELTTTIQMAQREGTVCSDIDVPAMVEIMAAAFFHGIQEARISREAFLAQNTQFLSQVHTMFRVPQERAANAVA